MNESHTKATAEEFNRNTNYVKPPAKEEPIEVRLAHRPDSPKKVFLTQPHPQFTVPTIAEMFDEIKRSCQMAIKAIQLRMAKGEIEDRDIKSLNTLAETLAKISIQERGANESDELNHLSQDQLEQMYKG